MLGADEVRGGAAVDGGREDKRRALHALHRVHVVLDKVAQQGVRCTAAQKRASDAACAECARLPVW